MGQYTHIREQPQPPPGVTYATIASIVIFSLIGWQVGRRFWPNKITVEVIQPSASMGFWPQIGPEIQYRTMNFGREGWIVFECNMLDASQFCDWKEAHI